MTNTYFLCDICLMPRDLASAKLAPSLGTASTDRDHEPEAPSPAAGPYSPFSPRQIDERVPGSPGLGIPSQSRLHSAASSFRFCWWGSPYSRTGASGEPLCTHRRGAPPGPPPPQAILQGPRLPGSRGAERGDAPESLRASARSGALRLSGTSRRVSPLATRRVAL